ncbi:endonuclease/exonuclease/phosphatase family protein [Euzebya tangerina]|uniref:endonuclease/exonuclease/phosphatase family protein n=1 Tax=Euzebya tangerina TaxID=591198 RepID=UPI0013C2F4CF|nr:endonuclease/exonuclease/phosphatase family protein [Euzebya tangerina]
MPVQSPGTSLGQVVSGSLSWLLASMTVAGVIVRAVGLDVGPLLIPAMAMFPYAVAAAALLCLVPWLTRNRVAAVTMTVAVGVGVLFLVPRAVGAPATVQAGTPEFRVASLNVLFGQARVEDVVRIAEQVDLLALQEIDQPFVEALTDAGIDEFLPHRVVEFRGGAGGSGVWSRDPLQPLAPVATTFATIHVEVQRSDRIPMSVAAVHPVPPIGLEGAPLWEEELATLADLAPLDIMLGDFNATADHRRFRAIVDRGMTDAAEAVGQGHRPTWPDRSWFPGIPLDHILTGPGVATLAFDVTPVQGSDHRAVIARLAVPDPTLSVPPEGSGS